MADVLPPLYQKWFDALLPGPLPSEVRATCSDCAMAKEPPPDAFHPKVKCCSYSPALPNFVVGAILADPGADTAAQRGRAQMEKQLAGKLEVTPLVMRPSPVYAVVYDAANRTGQTFGRSPAMRCQFFVDEGPGLCGIYRHRNSICSTWFCKFEHGARGSTLWSEIKALLGVLEESLSWWCVVEAGLGTEAFRALWYAERGRKGTTLDVPAIAGQPDLNRYARLWGPWAGREAEWYMQCAKLVEALTWQEVLAIGGAAARATAKLLRESYPRLAAPVVAPARVVRGPTLVQLGRRPDTAVARSQGAPYDPIEMPAAIALLLPRLVGQPLPAALATLRAEGVAIDDALIERLLDYEVLVPG